MTARQRSAGTVSSRSALISSKTAFWFFSRSRRCCAPRPDPNDLCQDAHRLRNPQGAVAAAADRDADRRGDGHR